MPHTAYQISICDHCPVCAAPSSPPSTCRAQSPPPCQQVPPNNKQHTRKSSKMFSKQKKEFKRFSRCSVSSLLARKTPFSCPHHHHHRYSRLPSESGNCQQDSLTLETHPPDLSLGDRHTQHRGTCASPLARVKRLHFCENQTRTFET